MHAFGNIKGWIMIKIEGDIEFGYKLTDALLRSNLRYHFGKPNISQALIY